MIYATSQSSSQNAFTIINGKPECSFYVFESENEFLNKQQEIWEKSKKSQNLIKQDGRLVTHHLLDDFVVFQNGIAINTGDFLDNEYQELEFFGRLIEQPTCRVVKGKKQEWNLESKALAQKEARWYGNQE